MATVLSPQRPLGSTGITVPLIGYGTAPLGKEKISPELAARCLNHAIDRGITYLDTSPDYGSEPRVGEVMRSRRDEVFLATKVNNRALEHARAEGLVRFIGITGHARPEILGHALTRYPFDTVLVALGMADRLVTSPETFLLPKAVERNTGVIAMKVYGHGEFPNRELALRYSLGLPGVSLAILGMDSTAHIDENVEIAANFKPLEEREEARLIEQVRPIVERDADESKKGESSLFWLHDTSVMGWSQKDEPAQVDY
jgi:aryl-alcohol dehydrogenase-like predicted oxidoreductase